jgi:FlaA1/EpsC-like NDP-sugar epimerase
MKKNRSVVLPVADRQAPAEPAASIAGPLERLARPVVRVFRSYLLYLFHFSPRARTAMVVALDLALCVFATLLAYSLRIGEWRVVAPAALQLVLITCVGWLIVAPLQGVYRSLFRFAGVQAIRDLAKSCILLSIGLIGVFVVLRINDRIPRTLAVLVPLLLFLTLASARSVLSTLLRETLYSQSKSGRRRVLIYGAGVTGRELSLSINYDPEFAVVGFVDDNPVLRGRRVDGHRIWHSSQLPEVLGAHELDEVLLAIPGASRARRRRIVEEVQRLAPKVGVRSLPNIAEIASGRVSVSDLREIQIEELLGRDQVAPDPRLMAANIRGKCVMVTGAGGSIGSELSRQIALEKPSRIILAERSELALYHIEGELRALVDLHGLDMAIEARLVDVSDRRDIERVFREFRPETVFHAAAYKHVPLVEADPLAGVRNNILGTYNCCTVGEKFGVRHFTLISTDKAVRPSSVMGCSKRVCELIVQARASVQDQTIYSAVRFGNVLGSSGSVVPLFRRQIASGGPVTITHSDATRYFMTVSEAAQLVVQAGSMAQGGEIFLLDMGEPVRIRELAMTMIQLSGLAVAGDDGSDGDIEIVDIGLRPGEKIHEELLIDRQGLPTSHPRIVKASERFASSLTFERLLAQLLSSIDERDCETSLAIVENLIAPALRNAPDVEGKASRGNRRRNDNVAEGESPPARRGVMIRKRAVES